MKKLVRLFLGMALCGAFCLAAEKPLPNPPPEFKKAPDSPSMVAMRQQGVMDIVDAVKKDELRPNCGGDENIHFRYGWTLTPGANQNVEMMAQQAEEPARESMGTKSEPAGKMRYKGGVQTWRKDTTLIVGSGDPKKCGQVVTYTGTWVGYAGGKLISVGASNVYQSKERGQAWIDEYIDKVMTVVK